MIPAWSPLGRLSPGGLSGRGSPASSNRCEPPLPRRRHSVIPRRLVASGSGRIALRCLVGIQRRLELPPFCLRKDLNEHDHHDTGPQGVTERIEQVGHQTKRLGRRRRFEQVSTDMSGQTNHQADREAPVQDSLLVGGPPHLRQVLAYPGQAARRSRSPRPNTSCPRARSASVNRCGASLARGPSVIVDLLIATSDSQPL
jgi:hypothetical protein